METSDWPPSNYPILFALFLLAATALVLAMGNKELAEELAIYAYYLLVIGVVIRMVEMALPDSTPETMGRGAVWLKSWVDVLDSERDTHVIHGIAAARHRLRPLREKLPQRLDSRLSQVKRSDLALVQRVSKDVLVNLGILYVLMVIYVGVFGWWTIGEYIGGLVLITIGIYGTQLIVSIYLRETEGL